MSKNHLENLWQPNSVNHPQKTRLDWDSSSHNSRAENTGCDKQEIIYVVALPSHQDHTPPNTTIHHHHGPATPNNNSDDLPCAATGSCLWMLACQ